MSVTHSTQSSSLLRNQLPAFSKSTWAMLGGIFVGSIGTHIIGAFLALFLTLQVGFSPSVASIILATFALAIMLGQIITAPLANRWGRKTAFVISLISEAVAAFLILVFPEAGWKTACILLIGLSWGAQQISGNSLLAELVQGSTQTEVYAWQRATFNLAAAVGAPLGGLMFAQGGARIMIVDSVVTLLFAITIAALVKTSSPAMETTHSQRAGSAYSSVLRDGAFMIFCLTMILIWMANAQTTSTLPIFLASIQGLPPQTIGWMMGILGAMAVAGQLFISRAFRNVLPNHMVPIGTMAIALGFIGLAVFDGALALTGALMILSVGSLILLPAASALTASRGLPNQRPTYFAVYGLSYSVGVFLGPILGGNILEHSSGNVVWIVFAVLLGFTGVFYWAIRKSKKLSLIDSREE